MDNTASAPPAHDAGEGRTDSVREELQEIKRLNAELKKALAYLTSTVIKQGHLLQEIREELPLAKVDAARGDRLYDTKELAGRSTGTSTPTGSTPPSRACSARRRAGCPEWGDAQIDGAGGGVRPVPHSEAHGRSTLSGDKARRGLRWLQREERREEPVPKADAPGFRESLF